MDKKEGCEFCVGGESILETRKMGEYTDSFVGIDVYIDGENKINIDACNEQKTGCSCYQEALIKIIYCPMCGRKL